MLLTQCWSLYISICFSYTLPRIFSFSQKVQLQLHEFSVLAAAPSWQRDCPACPTVCSVLHCVSSNTQTSFGDTLYDLSCDKSVQMGLFCSSLKFKVKEEINSIETSCSSHCSSSQSAEAALCLVLFKVGDSQVFCLCVWGNQ